MTPGMALFGSMVALPVIFTWLAAILAMRADSRAQLVRREVARLCDTVAEVAAALSAGDVKRMETGRVALDNLLVKYHPYREPMGLPAPSAVVAPVPITPLATVLRYKYALEAISVIESNNSVAATSCIDIAKMALK